MESLSSHLSHLICFHLDFLVGVRSVQLAYAEPKGQTVPLRKYRYHFQTAAYVLPKYLRPQSHWKTQAKIITARAKQFLSLQI